MWSNAEREAYAAADVRGAREILEQAYRSDLCSPCCDLRAVDIGPDEFSIHPLCSQERLIDHISQRQQSPRSDTELYAIPASHSRGSLEITKDGLEAVLRHVAVMPAMADILSIFAPDGTDFYVSRAGLHFGFIEANNPDRPLEMCCSFPYVEANDRGCEGPLQWSIRQMGFYQKFSVAREPEKIILVNPSIKVTQRIKAHFSTSPNAAHLQHWTVMTSLVCGTLAANWSSYVAALYKAVGTIRNDVAFAEMESNGNRAIPIERLKDGMMWSEMLQQALHALQNCVHILEGLKSESSKRQAQPLAQPDDTIVYENFRSGLDDTMRSLLLVRKQMELCAKRLKSSSIRDTVALQSTYTMEKMTKMTVKMTEKSVEEARTVRIIAIVTLLYLPPTFTATFLGMGYFTVTRVSEGGALRMSADPTGWLYLAITLPLMLTTLIFWLLWQWYLRRSTTRDVEAIGQIQHAWNQDLEKGIEMNVMGK